jgi:hypothetical protein
MNSLTLTLFLMAMFVGCSKPPTAPTAPAKPAGLPGYLRADDPTIGTEDAKAISIAKAHLEKTDGKPVDAYYRVTKTDDGFSVDVEYVTAYDNAGQPVFIPGGRCTFFSAHLVFIFSDFSGRGNSAAVVGGC